MPNMIDMFRPTGPGSSLDNTIASGKLIEQSGRRWAQIDGSQALTGPVLGGETLSHGDSILVGMDQSGVPYIIWPSTPGTGVDADPSHLVRNVDAPDPINESPVLISASRRDPRDGVSGLTTPGNWQFSVADVKDTDGYPNLTFWNALFLMVNTGDAGVYPGGARGIGRGVSGLGSSVMGIGNNLTAHGLDVSSGSIASKSDIRNVMNGQTVFNAPNITITREGSVFDIGMPVHAVFDAAGTPAPYIPDGTVIIDRVGRPANPSQITISQPITSFAGGTLHFWGKPGVTFSETIGILLTGIGSDGSFLSQPAGVGIAIQAYSDMDRYLTGISQGLSSVQPGGKNFLIRQSQALRIFSIENADNVASIITAAGTSVFTGSLVDIQGAVSAVNGLSFSAGASFSGSALNMPGHVIDTDTVLGLTIGKLSNRLIGFLGHAPVGRQAVAAAAVDAATTQTLANSLRTALINFGLAI